MSQAVEHMWNERITGALVARNARRENSLATSGYAATMQSGNDPLVITVDAKNDLRGSIVWGCGAMRNDSVVSGNLPFGTRVVRSTGSLAGLMRPFFDRQEEYLI